MVNSIYNGWRMEDGGWIGSRSSRPKSAIDGLSIEVDRQRRPNVPPFGEVARRPLGGRCPAKPVGRRGFGVLVAMNRAPLRDGEWEDDVGAYMVRRFGLMMLTLPASR